MRVVLDTNVLVSAFIARGACSEVFERVITEHQLIVSPWILDELERVLVKKLAMDPGRCGRLMELVRRSGELVDPPPLSLPVCRDSDDDNVLALALTGTAECLVTGDDDLLVLETFEGIPIILPREFLSRASR
jgi:putative PIN family toxin of toxin-antitoxin system